jgi:hypothetical protein
MYGLKKLEEPNETEKAFIRLFTGEVLHFIAGHRLEVIGATLAISPSAFPDAKWRAWGRLDRAHGRHRSRRSQELRLRIPGAVLRRSQGLLPWEPHGAPMLGSDCRQAQKPDGGRECLAKHDCHAPLKRRRRSVVKDRRAREADEAVTVMAIARGAGSSPRPFAVGGIDDRNAKCCTAVIAVRLFRSLRDE